MSEKIKLDKNFKTEKDFDPDYKPEGKIDNELPDGLMCGRCYEKVDELLPANCMEKPELLAGAPLGMYHCPDCGAMVLAGIPHPPLCKMCIDRVHPGFDNPEIKEKDE